MDLSTSKKMGRSMSDLTDDLVVDILSRLPVKSICRFKCVSRYWRSLITHPDHHKKFPQTLSGFFRRKLSLDDMETSSELVRLSRDELLPISTSSLSFLPGYEIIIPKGSCNGLLLCFCRKVYSRKEEYVVCNPATEEWIILPDFGDDEDGQLSDDYGANQGPICLCFDQAVSSHFHVFSMLKDADGAITEVNIYSSETGAWSQKENGWGEDTTIYDRSVFLNGMLHFISYDVAIVTVDREGTTWRTIPLMETMDIVDKFGSYHAIIEQSQGHLYYLNTRQRHDSILAVWILENYLSDEWVFKYNIDTSRLFGLRGGLGRTFTFIAIHPECNLIFYISQEDTSLQAYDMDRGKVYVIHEYIDHHRTWDPYFSYVPLFRIIGW